MIADNDFRAVLDSVNSGSISTLPKAELEQFTVVLCHKNAFAFFGNNQFPQICETVRLHLLRAHMDTLQKHITDLNSEGKGSGLDTTVLDMQDLRIAVTFPSGIKFRGPDVSDSYVK